MNFFAAHTFLILLFFFTHRLSGQDSAKMKSVQLTGYLKDLNIFNLPIRNQSLIYENILHNRINLDFQTNQWKSSAALRNRYFYSARNLISSLERLWIEYRTETWSVSVGKQRINWGMNNNWNPNDIFNTYNLLDFDFEERSGINGLKIYHRLSSKSGIEIGYKPGFKVEKIITAIKYNFHSGMYDWQLNGGFFHRRLSIGLGWQGGIGSTGFKGEVQYFQKNIESEAIFNGSLEWDYINSNGWYFSGSLLYCHGRLNKPPGDWAIVNFNSTPDHLMPTRWNSLITIRKEISPIISISATTLYSPSARLWILYPTGTFNLMNSFTMDLIWQSFWAQKNKGFFTIQHIGFIRLKISF